MMHVALMFISLTLGNWQISYNETTTQLEIVQTNGAVQISGKLAFTSGEEEWRIVAPRDSVNNRLAILDTKGNVQGYLGFQTDGNRVSLTSYHRTAQAYEGELSFDGKIKFTETSFACRTQPVRNRRILQLASGPADSALNDSLFDPEYDHALLVHAVHKQLKTLGPGRFGITLRGRIEKASEATWTFGFERNYYRSRYVPYYTPINRQRCPSPPTGWMSWNTYFDKATAEDNLAEARIGKKQLQPFGMEFWSIESWQDNSDKLPVSHFDNLSLTPNPRQFPKGMKTLAEDIRSLGFRPGIWLAPFGTGSESFYQKHKGWFLHDTTGKPMRTWNGIYTLDPSQPEVIDYLRSILQIASKEWGYEFFKIDGMSGRNHGYSAHFFERPEVKAAFKNPCPDPFERCVKAFREGIGEDSVFLACQGHVTGPEAAYADAARTGADIVHPNQPPRWVNLLNQARCTLNQIFAHNIVFFADPDTLLVGDFLGLEQARLSTTVVALPGQTMFAGDKLRELKPERMRLLQQALPVCDVRPLDLYPNFDMLPVWTLKISRPFGTWDVVALFNWSDQAASLGFNFAELGLDPVGGYVIYEFWNNTFEGIHKESFETSVPAHASRLLAVHPVFGRPQLLSSDRHITQGGVELKDLEWNADTRLLKGIVRTVRNYPLTLRFLIPEGYALKKASATPGITCNTATDCENVLALMLTSPKSRDVDFTLRF